MRTQLLPRLALGLAASLLAVPATRAATLELSGYGGVTLPFYSQTFTVSLVPPSNPIAGVAIQQERPLSLNANSGFVFALGATVYFGGAVGIEVRYDSAAVDITSEPPLYSIRLSKPFPNLNLALEPAPTAITLSSLTPVSLNLKLRTPGPLRFFISGGISYLPDFQLAVAQRLNVAVSGVSLPLDLGSLTARAVSRPEDPQSGRLGGNAGLGLQIKLGERVALVGEGRVFLFPKQVLTWQVSQQGGLVTLPAEALQALQQQLEPVRFNPAYFHLLGGIAFTF